MFRPTRYEKIITKNLLLEVTFTFNDEGKLESHQVALINRLSNAIVYTDSAAVAGAIADALNGAVDMLAEKYLEFGS